MNTIFLEPNGSGYIDEPRLRALASGDILQDRHVRISVLLHGRVEVGYAANIIQALAKELLTIKSPT